MLNLIPDAPSYDTIRLTLGVPEQKSQVTHRVDGRRYIYRPTVSTAAASRSEFARLVRTYFRGSPRSAVLALLEDPRADSRARAAEAIGRLGREEAVGALLNDSCTGSGARTRTAQ